MKALEFYAELNRIFLLDGVDRHIKMGEIHKKILDQYQHGLEMISTKKAAQTSSDGRTLIQVVGHILAWDRWMILGCGEIMAGVTAPQMMALKGYLHSDGNRFEFSSIDEFNAFQLEQQKNLPWEKVRSDAIHAAQTLYLLYTTLITPTLLESTSPARLRFGGGAEFNSTTGWQLWYITLEHEGVDHAIDLYPDE